MVTPGHTYGYLRTQDAQRLSRRLLKRWLMRVQAAESDLAKAGLVTAAVIFATEDHATTCRRGGAEVMISVYASRKTRSIREKLSAGAGSQPSSCHGGHRSRHRNSDVALDRISAGSVAQASLGRRKDAHAHRQLCRAPDVHSTSGFILSRSRAVISRSTAGRHTGTPVPTRRKRRHLLGYSREQATDHPRTQTPLSRDECLVRGVARYDHSVRRTRTTESAHARAAAPALSKTDDLPATPETGRSRISGPIHTARWTTRPLNSPLGRATLSRKRIDPAQEAS